MKILSFPAKNQKVILALGAESAGNFSVFKNGKIHFSQDFGDLLDENNFNTFKKSVLAFLKKEKITPNVILTDLHPIMKTTLWGEKLAKKFSAIGGSAYGGKTTHIQIQHHHAHIFSAVGDAMFPLLCTEGRCPDVLVGTEGLRKLSSTFYGIAMDGTGYEEDEKIWGGEVFKITNPYNCHYCVGRNLVANHTVSKIDSRIHGTNEDCDIQRIGHLENQTLLGGELAIKEPARMLISILSKFLSAREAFYFVKKYYTKNEFTVLHNQLEQNFNCLETSSTGRILDAVSVLLGFSGNERKEKHGPTYLLEKNSTKPYADLKPKIIKVQADDSLLENSKLILQTTPLFEYLIANLHKDRKRLATTAQLYIAEGLYEIIQKQHQPQTIFAAGGVTNNKIISNYFQSKNVYLNTQIPPGDAGLSFGQIFYYLFNSK